MRALVVQQDHVSPAGPVGDRLVERGYDVVEFLVVPADRFDEPGVDVDFPDPLDYDVICRWVRCGRSTTGPRSGWVQRRGRPAAARARRGRAGVRHLLRRPGARRRARRDRRARPRDRAGMDRVASAEPARRAGPVVPVARRPVDRPAGARVVARTAVAPQAFVSAGAWVCSSTPSSSPRSSTGWLDNGGRQYLLERGLEPEVLVTRRRGRGAVRRPATYPALVDRCRAGGRPAVRQTPSLVTAPSARCSVTPRCRVRAGSRGVRRGRLGRFTLAATEQAVAARLAGMPIDMSSMAAVSEHLPGRQRGPQPSRAHGAGTARPDVDRLGGPVGHLDLGRHREPARRA